MNKLPQRFGGFLSLGITMMMFATATSAQTASENPLRQARKSSPEKQANAKSVRLASHTSPSAPTAALRPTGFQTDSHRLASDRRSVITPRQESLTDTSIIGQELVEGDVIYEGEMIHEGEMIYEGDIDFEGGQGKVLGGDCCDGGGCMQCFSIPCPRICLDNFEVFAGVQGFTGPVNRGESGSFGFHEGFNWGAPLPCFGELGAQIGLQTTQSNLSGAEFTNETRHQLFLTGGIFRRVDWGLQGGLVLDYLADDWYANTSLTQLRGEISWVFPCVHELGFWFAASTDEATELPTLSTGPAVSETFESTDLYAFFYRHHFDAVENVQGRLYAGWTGDSDGLIGADLFLPLSCDWALQGGFAYLIPEESTGTVGRGHAEESWNVGMSLVWYPGARTASSNDYYRPLFNVAGNGSFMVGRR